MITGIFFALLILVFIIGMTLMRTGLFHLSGKKLKTYLFKWTRSPFTGLMTGMIVTGILQSSSAVMVITIGLISAKLLSFRQSIGIILGTNIGTTFTAEFIILDIDSLIIPMAFLGAFLLLFTRSKLQKIGLIFVGLSLIFSAMNGFEYLAEPIAVLSMMENIFNHLDKSHLFGIFAGLIVTAIIQSSTATTGITMGFLSEKFITIESGIAIMLGANIGTCVTAILASIGSGHESKLCAYSHVWVNVIGVLLFFPFIDLLGQIAHLLTDRSEAQLAHISVLFNVIVSFLFLPFVDQFANVIMKLHGQKT